MRLDNKLTAKIREVFDKYEDQHADYGWQELRKKYPATPLTAKIREVFDKYEDQHADYGWQELRKKYTATPLTAKIREVFDNYEDPQADYGWQELRKKYPAKHDRKPLAWWMSAAAAVLIVALGVWIAGLEEQQNPSFTTKINANGSKSTLQNSSDSVTSQQPKGSDSDENTINNDQEVALNLAQDKETTFKGNRNEIIVTRNNSSFNKSSKKEIGVTNDNVSPLAANADQKLINTPTETPISLITINSSQKEALADVLVKSNNQLPDSVSTPNNLSQQVETSLPENTNKIEKKRTLLDLALEEDSKKKKKENTKSDKKVIFGVYAGSFISYAAGSENKVNLGAGFSSDISITKNLKLSTGIALTQNALSFTKNIPLSAQASFQNSIQQNQVVSDEQKGFAAATLKVISYKLDSYDATLLGLDIPINLKYSFSKRSNEYFLSAGFSSGTFLSESYTYKYSSSGPSYEKLPNTDPVLNEDKVKKNSGKFDVARMLNISFGMGYPLGKKNKLIIEPFLKYPLKDVGAENLRFGAGGVNLKLNFQASKSKK